MNQHAISLDDDDVLITAREAARIMGLVHAPRRTLERWGIRIQDVPTTGVLRMLVSKKDTEAAAKQRALYAKGYPSRRRGNPSNAETFRTMLRDIERQIFELSKSISAPQQELAKRLRAALIEIRDECANGAAYDIAVRALADTDSLR